MGLEEKKKENQTQPKPTKNSKKPKKPNHDAKTRDC